MKAQSQETSAAQMPREGTSAKVGRPSLGEIRCDAFEQDVVVNDRHQSFSAELLRLALLGVGGVGYLAAKSLSAPAGGGFQIGRPAKWLVLMAAVSFGLSAASALALRYIAADLLAFQLRIVRLRIRAGLDDPTVADAEEVRRNSRLKATRPLLVTASAFLVFGAAALIGFVFLVFRP